MIRLGVPIFRSRISPVFDSCTTLLLVDIIGNREVNRREIFLNELSLTERVAILRKSEVTTVICGGISDMLENMLLSVKIDLIPDISGTVDQILVAYLSGNLNAPRFKMPGANVIRGEKRENP